MSDFFAIDDEYMWTVVAGFVVSFILALGIGANDVANSFGPSVGSGVLTLKHACIIATIFETLGAVLLGGKVAETVRKGIIDTSYYENSTELFLAGNVAALSGSCVWLIIATALKLPVSTSHSIVGATIGYSLVAFGAKSVNWKEVVAIACSWVISPVFSGIISWLVFLICEFFILKKPDPLEPGLRWLHIFYAVTVTINFISIFADGPEMLHLHRIPMWGNFILSCGTGAITGWAVWQWLVPWQRKTIKERVRISELEEAYYLEHPEEDEEEEGEEGEDETKEQEGVDNKAFEVGELEKKGGNDQTAWDSYFGTKDTEAACDGVLNGYVNRAEITDNKYTTKEIPVLQNGTADIKEKSLVSNGANAHPLEQENQIKEAEDKEEDEGEPVVLGCEYLPVIARDDRPETYGVFAYLLILTAMFGSFVHGGNDVANAIGPFVSIWLTAQTGEVENEALTPIWILLYGGIGIAIGLWIWGRRVIETVGSQLAKITPTSAFPIDIGAATTVLIASNLGLPISTTHCKVGSIVCVGYYRTRNVNWGLFGGIFTAWVVTLPVAGGVSAAFMAIFMLFTPKYSS